MDSALNIIFRIGFLVIPIIILYMVIGLILALPLMWLWNYTLPDITNGFLNYITYWQAWTIIVMFSILFGGGSRD
ncbi:MAG: hypothetical protein KKA79_01115 [Nanoarchaeota archaeon]|nr:hypothetical protein [Nanoarchaeota archaeon]MCG2718568.1 hypothetical protein [Nanoarchaeota archaeon]